MSPQLSWERAGSLFVVGLTAYAAVRVVMPQPGETVAVSAAAGEVSSYDDGLAARLREAAPNRIDVFIDWFGPEYVQLAVDLDVTPERIDTTVSVQKADEVGAKTGAGREARAPEVFADIADLVATGGIDFDIAATFPIDQVTDAFEELERRHTHSRIVLLPRRRDSR
jgi:NADPH2:quinone reductase